MAKGRLNRNPKAHVQNVMVVSHDFRQQARNATTPLMTQCQMANWTSNESDVN